MTTVDHLTAVGEAVRAGAIVLTADGWYAAPGRMWGAVERLLPPDLEGGDGQACPERNRLGPYGCTRILGHTGRHSASDGVHIIAVWGSR